MSLLFEHDENLLREFKMEWISLSFYWKVIVFLGGNAEISVFGADPKATQFILQLV